jgi:hypothetical protein
MEIFHFKVHLALKKRYPVTAANFSLSITPPGDLDLGKKLYSMTQNAGIPHFHTASNDELTLELYKQQSNYCAAADRGVNWPIVEWRHLVLPCSAGDLTEEKTELNKIPVNHAI